jgi:hypothetical protein
MYDVEVCVCQNSENLKLSEKYGKFRTENKNKNFPKHQSTDQQQITSNCLVSDRA